MNLCRCERGHFYDKEKYASCPHCAGGSAEDNSLTYAFTSSQTVPADIASSQSQQGGAAFSAVPGGSAASQTVSSEVSGSSLPMADWPANQNTMGMGINDDMPTVPLEDPEETDDHTIGFFDDVFTSAAGAGKGPSAGSGPSAAKRPSYGNVGRRQEVHKVSTPCVGWLVALGGEHLGTDFRLKVGKNFIGRNPQMDVALTEDKSVSRDRHAIVVYEPKAHLYLVQPGESSSLVYLNNKVVLTPMEMEAYDMITVGDVNLLFIPLCGERFNWGDVLESMRNKD